MQGICGKMFDFNNNGKLDSGEIAAELFLLDKVTKSSEEDDIEDDPFEYDDGDSDYGDD